LLILRPDIGAAGNGDTVPKKKRRDTQAKQSKRFVETARALESDESGKAFDKAIKTLLPPLKNGKSGHK
jgi:hypothetical protein